LYGLKFFYQHVLHKPWEHIKLITTPHSKKLPDIVTREKAAQLFSATQKLSYRAFFFTLYSLGSRLGEGFHLEVSDIDARRQRVHIRDTTNCTPTINNPAASYLATRSEALQLPVQTLRRLNKKLTQQAAGN